MQQKMQTINPTTNKKQEMKTTSPPKHSNPSKSYINNINNVNNSIEQLNLVKALCLKAQVSLS